MAKILLVEDNNDINTLIAETFNNDYKITQAYSGTEAKTYINNEHFDLVITDLMIPGISGEELIQYIRKVSMVPIIVITAKMGVDVLVDVLDLGANDYLAKPFNIKELVARTRMHILGHAKNDNVNFVYQAFRLDRKHFIATYNNQDLGLLLKEFELLALFLKEPERVYTKEQIYKYVWKDTYFGDENTINVHISRLRSKLKKISGQTYIKTIRGLGYRFKI